jgi:hypothetical protein
MARFSAVYSPKSASGGVNDIQNATVTAASSAEIVVGFRQMIRVSNGNIATATIKFGVSGMGAAVATDHIIGLNQFQDFEMGDEFDRVRIFSAGTSVIVTVMRLTS